MKTVETTTATIKITRISVYNKYRKNKAQSVWTLALPCTIVYKAMGWACSLAPHFYSVVVS